MSVKDSMNDKDKLTLLDDLLFEEVCGMTDEEILAEVSPAEIAETRSIFEKARAAQRRARMARAQAAVALERSRPALPPASRARGAQVLGALRARDGQLDRKLTLAARNGGGDTDLDQAGIEEDLAELEAMEAQRQGDEK